MLRLKALRKDSQSEGRDHLQPTPHIKVAYPAHRTSHEFTRTPPFSFTPFDVCCCRTLAAAFSSQTGDAPLTQLCDGKRHWSGIIPRILLDNMAAVQPSQGNMQQSGNNAASAASVQGVLPPGVSKEQLQAMYKVGHHALEVMYVHDS